MLVARSLTIVRRPQYTTRALFVKRLSTMSGTILGFY